MVRAAHGAFALAAGLAVSVGCRSPRQRDCHDLRPLADAAMRACVTGLPLDAGPARVFATASASCEASTQALQSAIHSAPLRDKALGPKVAALTDALTTAAAGTRGIQDAIDGMHLDLDLATLIQRLPPRPESTGLFFAPIIMCLLPKDPMIADCQALTRALDDCQRSVPDDSLAAAIDACTASMDSLKLGDPSLHDGVHDMVAALRWARPLAEHVGIPARTAMAQLASGARAAQSAAEGQERARTANDALTAACVGP
jgi:hypothetical protein